ncbi:MAG: hypothetical protein WBG46_12615 [Nonlabens sp.]
MTNQLKEYELTIKKKHSFSLSPKYEEQFRTKLNKKVFGAIVIKTFIKLGWELVYHDENSAEAKTKGGWNESQEKISVTFDHGNVTVESVSLGNEIWDNGRNSKRVLLFKYAFQQTEKEYDKEALIALEQEVDKVDNWDDYAIPERLPQPKNKIKPTFLIALIGGFIVALLTGLLVAYLSVETTYIIGLFEIGVALVLGFSLSQLIKISNYTNHNHLHYLMIGMIILTYISNQYFQYQIILNSNNYNFFSFWEFIDARFDAGLQIKSMNTGWIGLLISWIFQILFTYFICYLRLSTSLISYAIERVPVEVIDFACYHFIKEKNENQVRAELARMGWSKTQNQDEVFEAIDALHGAAEIRRM